MEYRGTAGSESRVSGRTIVGYAAVFNTLSEPIPIKGESGHYREMIRPGAFSRSIRDHADVAALVNHDINRLLGRTAARTLRLEEDSRGLKIEIDPPDTSVGNDVIESLQRGDLSRMSFSFTPTPNGSIWSARGADGFRRCERTDLVLHDVSIVVSPAYQATSVSVRGIDEPVDFRWYQVDGAHVPKRWTVEEAERRVKEIEDSMRREQIERIEWEIECDEQRIAAAEAACLIPNRYGTRQQRDLYFQRRLEEIDRKINEDYRQREKERRKIVEGRCEKHRAFSCLTCHPPSFGPPIIIS